jgi:MATE family multidrug resistance protein
MRRRLRQWKARLMVGLLATAVVIAVLPLVLALATLAIYLVAGWLLQPFGNHGLWGALYVSYLVRAGTLLYYYPALVRSVPA